MRYRSVESAQHQLRWPQLISPRGTVRQTDRAREREVDFAAQRVGGQGASTGKDPVGADRCVELRLSQQKPRVARPTNAARSKRRNLCRSVCLCATACVCVGPKSNCASCRPFLRVGGNSLVLMPATATAAGSGKRQLRTASRMRHAAVWLTGKPHVPPLSADHMRLTRQPERETERVLALWHATCASCTHSRHSSRRSIRFAFGNASIIAN